jgi:glycosyltransferase involved in cell wall biosynthesis
MREFVLAEGMSDVAFELAWASDEQLRAPYSSATALLFPSLREGFGWPIIEAQACDCPVITSNRSPMDEVAGEAAVYVDPEDPDGAASIIKPFLTDGFDHLKRPSLENSARFNVGTMIGSYVTLFEDLCHGREVTSLIS